MGCDIHSRAQKQEGGKWVDLPFKPFDWRSYGMYGFLADVRNYSAVPPISPARGLPEDIVRPEPNFYGEYDDHLDLGDHSFSWLTVAELLAFDYDQPVEDRRVTRQIAHNLTSGAVTAEPGEGEMTTYRAFLGQGFFDDLQKLKDIGAERVVFGFDS